MAAAATVPFSASRFLHRPSSLAELRARFASTCALSKVGPQLLLRRGSVPARELVIRAARTESKGVSSGFRAPQFQLEEPLTGKMWSLEDFESYPALL
ncbi:hypothetical protein CRG98_022118, partial [Punica granatum]